jgi:hypothetical protein
MSDHRDAAAKLRAIMQDAYAHLETEHPQAVLESVGRQVEDVAAELEAIDRGQS